MAAHSSGALWIAETSTAIIADAHLGYSWAQRRRGELGPLLDSQTAAKLHKLCDSLQPKEIVFLGDIVHAPRPCAPEREWIEKTLTDLSRCATLVAVRGNHDRAFAREFAHLPVRTTEVWSNATITAIHGDHFGVAFPNDHALVVGHLHPSLGVPDGSGAAHKLPVFLVNSACIVLPAFSPFAGGYDVAAGIPAELQSLFGDQPIQTFAVTATRTVALGPLSRALQRINSLDVSAPAQFRGHRRSQSSALP